MKIQAYKVLNMPNKVLLVGQDDAGWYFVWKLGMTRDNIWPDIQSLAQWVGVELEDTPYSEKIIPRQVEPG